MAKVIDLSGKLKQAAPVKGSFQMPPKSAPRGSTTAPVGPNQMPLQTNRIIHIKKPTAAEEPILRSIGWKPGDPVPENLADLISAAGGVFDEVANDLENAPPPLPLDTPPLVLPAEQPLSSLSEERQQMILEAMAAAREMGEVSAYESEQQINPEVRVAAKQTSEELDIGVVDDTDTESYAGTTVPKHRHSNTGADAPLTSCPRCSWDLSRLDTVLVTDVDKDAFLQTLLGGLPFVKTYTIMGGKMDVVLRSLTPKEVDMAWKQCYIEKSKDQIANLSDFNETLQRYRVSMQLQSISAKGVSINDLPDTLDGWITSLQASGVEIPADGTPLPMIRDYVYEHVLRTENISRMVGELCTEFNRLQVKLEANMETPGFW